MAEPAASTPATPTGFELYDPTTDPAVKASNDHTAAGLAAATKPPLATGQAPPAAPSAATESATPAKPKHSPILVSRAKRFGFTEEEVNDLSPDELKELLRDTAVAALVDRAAPEPDVSVPSHAAAPEPAAAPPIAEAPAGDDELVKALKEDVDPAVADAIAAFINKKLQGHGERLGKVEEATKYALSFVESKRAEESDNQIDQGFSDLGAGFEKVFGAGNAQTLDRNSPAFKRRVAIVRELRANPPKDGNIRKAIAELGKKHFGDLAAGAPSGAPSPASDERPRKQPRASNGRFSEQDYQDATMAVPTSRLPAEEPAGREKAIKTVREIQSRNGRVSDDDINQGEDKFL
jgi:hypothetical protein